MRKIIGAIVLVIIVGGIMVVFSSMSMEENGGKLYQEIDKVEVAHEPERDITKSTTVSPEQAKEDMLSKLENQVFFTKEESPANANDETIIEFGKAFVNLYNGAIQKQKKVSFENYIDNKNLREFTDKMLDLTQKQKLQGGSMVIYGLDNEFKEVTLEPIEDGVYYLELRFVYGGSGMVGYLLITEEYNSLKLADLYFGTKDGVDTFATGHMATRKVNNPRLWDDEEWVEGVAQKLEEFERDYIRKN